jgi:hypothetical protein
MQPNEFLNVLSLAFVLESEFEINFLIVSQLVIQLNYNHSQKNQLDLPAGVYFWTLDSFPLINVSVFKSIPYYFHYFGVCSPVYFEIKYYDALIFALFTQDCFDCLRNSLFSYEV